MFILKMVIIIKDVCAKEEVENEVEKDKENQENI